MSKSISVMHSKQYLTFRTVPSKINDKVCVLNEQSVIWSHFIDERTGSSLRFNYQPKACERPWFKLTWIPRQCASGEKLLGCRGEAPQIEPDELLVVVGESGSDESQERSEWLGRWLRHSFQELRPRGSHPTGHPSAHILPRSWVRRLPGHVLGTGDADSQI